MQCLHGVPAADSGTASSAWVSAGAPTTAGDSYTPACSVLVSMESSTAIEFATLPNRSAVKSHNQLLQVVSRTKQNCAVAAVKQAVI